jgi:hypothetical protein
VFSGVVGQCQYFVLVGLDVLLVCLYYIYCSVFIMFNFFFCFSNI